MNNNKVLGTLLLGLAIYTIVGMVLENFTFWKIYNYITILLTVSSGIVLLRKK